MAYDDEGNDTLPPTIGIGLESERQRWKTEHGKRAKDVVWNPAEFHHYEKSHTQLSDDALDEACDYPLLFATIIGAHVLPLEKIVGLEVRDETVEQSMIVPPDDSGGRARHSVRAEHGKQSSGAADCRALPGWPVGDGHREP